MALIVTLFGGLLAFYGCLSSILGGEGKRFQPICTIPVLCEQETAYNIPSAGFTVLTLPRQNVTEGSICVAVIPAHQLHFTSDYFCQTMMIVDETIFVTIPFNIDYLFHARLYTIIINNTVSTSWSALLFPVSLDFQPQFLTKIHVKNLPFGLQDTFQLQLDFTQAAITSHRIDFMIESLFNSIIPSDVDTAATNENVEPGTWFITLTPYTKDDTVITLETGEQQIRLFSGFPTYKYVEFVLADEDIIKQRLFSSNTLTSTSQNLEVDLKNSLRHSFAMKYSVLQAQQPQITAQTDSKRIHVCVWANSKMDGQRRIWLLQFQHLDKDLFRFTYSLSLTDEDQDDVDSMQHDTNHILHYLQPHVAVQYRRFLRIEINDLSQLTSDGELSADQIWQGNLTRLYEYVHHRHYKAHGILNNIEPVWAKELYLDMASYVTNAGCDILVYGNARASVSDNFIINIGHSLGIPTVTELMNLYLDDKILPDVIVAPSKHSLMHESIQHPIQAKQELLGYSSTSVVIQPAVDLHHFQLALYENETFPVERAINCVTTYTPSSLTQMIMKHNKHFPCVLIGFIGRLNPEKNPGLFLQMAYHLHQQMPTARFRFIGDGPLRSSLQQLVQRMQLEHVVQFIGWVSYNDLPRYLLDLDLVVNPSLRGWSETFCIANIEAMAMGRALATFAVGGIGEYIQAPMENETDRQWSITENALIFHTANPIIMAQAVLSLLQQPIKLRQIAEAGRKVVEEYFDVERQMKQYSELYQAIYRARNHS